MRIRGEVRPALTGAFAVLASWTVSPWAHADCGDGVFDDEEECDMADERVAESCTEECRFRCTTNVHDELTDHTCIHVTNGPYQATFASPYPGPAPLSDIGTGHVYYTVALATNEAGETVDSAVNVTAFGDVDVAIYLNEPESVTLMDSRGQTVPVLFDAPITTCAAGLRRVLVYSLVSAGSYLMIFPAQGAPQRSLVFENATGKKYEYSRDADGDGFGDPQYTLRTWCKVEELGFVRNTEDCDDARSRVYPGAPELCDDVDNDCDGSQEVSNEPCESAPGPDETSATAASSVSPPDAHVVPVVVADAGIAGATIGDSSTRVGETSETNVSDAAERDASSSYSDAEPSEQPADELGADEETRKSLDAGDANSTADSDDVRSRARSEGCGCAVHGTQAGRNAWGVGALSALVVLSCGLRRRVRD